MWVKLYICRVCFLLFVCCIFYIAVGVSFIFSHLWVCRMCLKIIDAIWSAVVSGASTLNNRSSSSHSSSICSHISLHTGCLACSANCKCELECLFWITIIWNALFINVYANIHKIYIRMVKLRNSVFNAHADFQDMRWQSISFRMQHISKLSACQKSKSKAATPLRRQFRQGR